MEAMERYIRTECNPEEVYTQGVLREFKVGIGEEKFRMNVMKKGGTEKKRISQFFFLKIINDLKCDDVLSNEWS